MILLVFFTVNMALWTIRVRGGHAEGRFQVPVAVSVVGAAASLLLMGFLPFSALARAGAILLLGMVLVMVWRHRSSRVGS